MPDPSSHEPNLLTHPLVRKLHGDSDTPPSLVALTGYFGPSKKADSIRLYPSLDFKSYFEIPRAAIVATTPVDADDEESPTVVYVKVGTPVESVQASTQPVESYLQGGITGAFQPLIDGSQPLPWVVHPITTVLPTHQVVCLIHPTTTVLPTRQVVCQPRH